MYVGRGKLVIQVLELLILNYILNIQMKKQIGVSIQESGLKQRYECVSYWPLKGT